MNHTIRFIPSFAVMLMIVGVVSSFAQTVLIKPDAEGGFENGPTFAANGWTVVNDVVNAWAVGTATMNGGLRGAYISDDGGFTNRYAGTVAQVSHFYRDVEFPADEPLILLRFRYRGGSSDDRMNIFLIPTESTPIAGIELASSVRIGGEYHRIKYLSSMVIIPRSAAGTKKRLVFSWRNDDMTGIQPPVAIDNIELVSEPSKVSSAAGGNYDFGETWVGGSPPTSSENALIVSPVTIDTDVQCQKLVVAESAILEFESATPRTCEVASHAIVSEGGMIRSPETGNAFHKLIVDGDLTNNGTLDFSTNSGQAGVGVKFRGGSGDDQLFSGTGPVTDITSITVNTANPTDKVSIETDNLTVQGQSTNAPGFLIPQNGLFEMLEDVPLACAFFTTANWTIPAGATVRLKDPNLIVTAQSGSGIIDGSFHIMAGEVNVGTSSDHTLAFTSGAAFTVDGGLVKVSGVFCVTPPSSPFNFDMGGGEIIAATAGGTTSTVNATFDLGTSSSSVIRWTGGNVVIQNSSAASIARRDFRIPTFASLNITDAARVQLGNANTPGPTVWNIEGAIPNLSIDGTFAHTVQQSGNATLRYSEIFRSGETFNVNGHILTAMKDLTVESGGTLDATAAGSTGSTSTFITRRGNGQLLIAPTFGTGVTQNVQYIASTQPTVIGNEFPTDLNGTLEINNPNGVILSDPHTVAGLTLTSGTLTTASTSLLTVTGTTPLAVSGGSNISYVVGPLRRIVSASSPSGDYPFPVGNSGINTVTLVNPLTTGDVTFEAEVFDGNSGGTPGTGLASLNENGFWKISSVDGVDVFVEAVIAIFSKVILSSERSRRRLLVGRIRLEPAPRRIRN